VGDKRRERGKRRRGREAVFFSFAHGGRGVQALPLPPSLFPPI